MESGKYLLLAHSSKEHGDFLSIFKDLIKHIALLMTMKWIQDVLKCGHFSFEHIVHLSVEIPSSKLCFDCRIDLVPIFKRKKNTYFFFQYSIAISTYKIIVFSVYPMLLSIQDKGNHKPARLIAIHSQFTVSGVRFFYLFSIVCARIGAEKMSRSKRNKQTTSPFATQLQEST